jgi:hypothetical protein
MGKIFLDNHGELVEVVLHLGLLVLQLGLLDLDLSHP